jgi:uncharacterized membrane protein
MSKEYTLALILVIGSILKAFNIEIPNETLEAVLTGIVAIVIAVIRYKKGDITVLGSKKA